MRWRPELRPGPRWGSLQRSPYPKLDFGEGEGSGGKGNVGRKDEEIWEREGREKREVKGWEWTWQVQEKIDAPALDTWLARPLRKTITMSSLLHCNHQQTGGDPLDVHEPPGWEQFMRMFSLRTLGSILHGGRQDKDTWQQVVSTATLW